VGGIEMQVKNSRAKTSVAQRNLLRRSAGSVAVNAPGERRVGDRGEKPLVSRPHLRLDNVVPAGTQDRVVDDLGLQVRTGWGDEVLSFP
jgi:hypothetical protein